MLYRRIILRNYFGSFISNLNNSCSLLSFCASSRQTLWWIDFFCHWLLKIYITTVFIKGEQL